MDNLDVFCLLAPFPHFQRVKPSEPIGSLSEETPHRSSRAGRARRFDLRGLFGSLGGQAKGASLALPASFSRFVALVSNIAYIFDHF
jgi:hypothetical protein